MKYSSHTEDLYFLIIKTNVSLLSFLFLISLHLVQRQIKSGFFSKFISFHIIKVSKFSSVSSHINFSNNSVFSEFISLYE